MSKVEFKVSLIEPLSPEDKIIYDWVIDQAGDYIETGDRKAIEALLTSCQENPMLEAQMQPEGNACPIPAGANAKGFHSEGARMQHMVARLQQEEGGDATTIGENATEQRRACNKKRRSCNTLNSLNLLVNLLESLDLKPMNPLEANSEDGIYSQADEATRSVIVVDPAWILPAIFTRNPEVKTTTQKLLIQKNASAQAFVSWLLYAASPKGNGISKPALFAASKLVTDPQAGAGSTYDRLAALPPKSLFALLNDALNGICSNANITSEARQDWQSVLARSPIERLAALKGQLFG